MVQVKYCKRFGHGCFVMKENTGEIGYISKIAVSILSPGQKCFWVMYSMYVCMYNADSIYLLFKCHISQGIFGNYTE